MVTRLEGAGQLRSRGVGAEDRFHEAPQLSEGRAVQVAPFLRLGLPLQVEWCQ